MRVRLLGQELPVPAALPIATSPPSPDAAELPHAALLVHIEGVGDRSVPFGAWGGDPGSGRAIEGFALRPDDVLPADAIEYQADFLLNPG